MKYLKMLFLDTWPMKGHKLYIILQISTDKPYNCYLGSLEVLIQDHHKFLCSMPKKSLKLIITKGYSCFSSHIQEKY